MAVFIPHCCTFPSKSVLITGLVPSFSGPKKRASPPYLSKA